MGDGVVEGLGGLARQCSTGRVGNGAGDHDRQFKTVVLKELLGRVNGGLGVQGVENGFDKDQIGAAFHQPGDRFIVVIHQGLEVHVPVTRVVDVW